MEGRVTACCSPRATSQMAIIPLGLASVKEQSLEATAALEVK